MGERPGRTRDALGRLDRSWDDDLQRIDRWVLRVLRCSALGATLTESNITVAKVVIEIFV